MGSPCPSGGSRFTFRALKSPSVCFATRILVRSGQGDTLSPVRNALWIRGNSGLTSIRPSCPVCRRLPPVKLEFGSRTSLKIRSSPCRAQPQAFRARNALWIRAGRSDCRPGVSFRNVCPRRRHKEQSRISHKHPCHAGDILAGTLLRACAVAHAYPIRRAALPRNLLSLTARGPSVVANPFAVRSVRKIKDG